jgi:hypothetical protein
MNALILALCFQPATASPAKPLVDFPHPLITEVLYNVPRDGDANGDGSRDANGDEFVELVNPHDKPIQLRGYTISGKEPRARSGASAYKPVKFTFPEMELAPGEIVVVFNGYGQKWTGPVGDSAKAPDKGNDNFAGARILSMKIAEERVGFGNGGDFVLLTAPGGEKIHCIKWGQVAAPDAKLAETAPEGQGSVTRETVAGPLALHPPTEGKPFSPGHFAAKPPK